VEICALTTASESGLIVIMGGCVNNIGYGGKELVRLQPLAIMRAVMSHDTHHIEKFRGSLVHPACQRRIILVGSH
jgi:hypothetical protein